MKWFKFFGQDWLTDTKILSLSIEDKMCYLTILCLVSASESGYINSSEEVILHLSKLDSKTSGVLQRLNDNKMLEYDNAGCFTIKNFIKRQGESLTGYERVKKYREKQKSINNKTKKKTKDNKKDNIVDVINDNAKSNQIKSEQIIENTDTTSKEVIKIIESDSKEIPLIFKEFESINPSVKRMYGNKTQRQACSDLIKTYTFEKTIQVISEILPQIKGQPFFPEIGTPYELFNKWSKLESAIIRYGKEKNIKSKVAF